MGVHRQKFSCDNFSCIKLRINSRKHSFFVCLGVCLSPVITFHGRDVCLTEAESDWAGTLPLQLCNARLNCYDERINLEHITFQLFLGLFRPFCPGCQFTLRVLGQTRFALHLSEEYRAQLQIHHTQPIHRHLTITYTT